MPKGIYLDNNTITHPSEQAVANMLPFLMEKWGTPSAPHVKGQELYPTIDESLRSIYALLGAKESDDFVFTSGNAEATNQVIFSTYFDVTVHTGKNQFITTAIDEAPSILAIGRLEALSCVGRMALADKNGQITADAIKDMMTPRTALVSMSFANGLTGVINPIDEIAALCKERGARLHLEMSPVLGRLFLSYDDLPADFLSFGGDSIHAPSGTGGLLIRHDVKCSPFILGGVDQGGYRAGTYSIAGLAALGQAAREALDMRDLMSTEVARLRGKLEESILEAVSGSVIFFKDSPRLPQTTAIGFPGVLNEALLYALNSEGVYASIGGGAHQQIGLVLEASGVETTLAHSALSFSLSRETTEDEIDRSISIIKRCVENLRKLSLKICEDK